MRGRPEMILGEIAAIGSFRYCLKSSSAMGSVEKNENFDVTGIISARQRKAISSTVDLDQALSVLIAWFDCNRAAR